MPASLSGMRKLSLLLLFGVALAVRAPALAADFPIFTDGGSQLRPADGGYYIGVDTRKTEGYRGVIRCTPFGVYYCVAEGSACSTYDCVTNCPDDGGSCTYNACVPTQANLYLAPEVTYDIDVPKPYNQLGIKTFDGGVPVCNLFYRRDRGE